MTKYQEGVEAIRRWSEQHKAIVELAGALDEVDSLDLQIMERRRALVSANEDLRQVQIRISESQTELQKIQEGHAKAIEKHDAATKGVIESARYQAESIVKDARRDADELRAVAARDVEHLRADHAESMANALNELQDLKTQIEEARSVLDDLKSQHAEVNDKIEAVRQTAKSLFSLPQS